MSLQSSPYTGYSNDVPSRAAEPSPRQEDSDPLKIKFLSVGQVAEMLGVAKVSIYRLVARREIPVYRFMRRICFKESDVLAWIERCKFDSRH